MSKVGEAVAIKKPSVDSGTVAGDLSIAILADIGIVILIALDMDLVDSGVNGMELVDE